MIKAILISDSSGFPFYSRSVNSFEELNKNLFSGLICAIGKIGKKLFKQNLATIHFGANISQSHMIVISKQLFSEKKIVYFAFFIEGECNHILIKEIAASIFIEVKSFLSVQSEHLAEIQLKIDNLLAKKYGNLNFCL